MRQKNKKIEMLNEVRKAVETALLKEINNDCCGLR